MKFEKIDGIQYVVLDENEKINLTTPNNLMVEISQNNNTFNIFGNSSIINFNNEKDNSNKENIAPIISKEEIIEKCDQWLDMFKKVHDEFKKRVLTDKYRKQNVVMELGLGHYYTSKDDENGCYINLSLEQYTNRINSGVSIHIDNSNSSIYKYLAASVLDYYVSENLIDNEIDFMEFNGTLYSSFPHESVTVPMLANLCGLKEDSEYSGIVYAILGYHNLGESSEEYINSLKDDISDQRINETMNYGIEKSSKQYKNIFKTSNSKK